VIASIARVFSLAMLGAVEEVVRNVIVTAPEISGLRVE
jgi:hypothetical protein